MRINSYGVEVYEKRGPPRTFEEQLEALKQFKREHGHCNVPSKYPEDPKLASWVKEQRKCRVKENDKPEYVARKSQLIELGFQHDPPKNLEERTTNELDNWFIKYEELVQFNKKHGHCRVPTNPRHSKKEIAELNPLGQWVIRQRLQKKKVPLLPEQREKLLALKGFQFGHIKQAKQDGKSKDVIDGYEGNGDDDDDGDTPTKARRLNSRKKLLSRKTAVYQNCRNPNPSTEVRGLNSRKKLVSRKTAVSQKCPNPKV